MTIALALYAGACWLAGVAAFLAHVSTDRAEHLIAAPLFAIASAAFLALAHWW